MRAIMMVGVEGREGVHRETVDVPDGVDPYVHCHDIIWRFNTGMRAGESGRWLSSVQPVNEPAEKHTWDKTNLVTINKGGRMYDTVECTICGVTAKRFGIGGGEVLDAKFKRHERWASCAQSVAHLIKTGKMQDTPEIPALPRRRYRRPAPGAEK